MFLFISIYIRSLICFSRRFQNTLYSDRINISFLRFGRRKIQPQYVGVKNTFYWVLVHIGVFSEVWAETQTKLIHYGPIGIYGSHIRGGGYIF